VLDIRTPVGGANEPSAQTIGSAVMPKTIAALLTEGDEVRT
jgi:hypothetical protein